MHTFKSTRQQAACCMTHSQAAVGCLYGGCHSRQVDRLAMMDGQAAEDCAAQRLAVVAAHHFIHDCSIMGGNLLCMVHHAAHLECCCNSSCCLLAGCDTCIPAGKCRLLSCGLFDSGACCCFAGRPCPHSPPCAQHFHCCFHGPLSLQRLHLCQPLKAWLVWPFSRSECCRFSECCR